MKNNILNGRIPAILLSFIVAATMITVPVQADAATIINVQTHTQDDILNFINQTNVGINDPVTYAIKPGSAPPYNEGALTSETLTSALGVLNIMRYIAGIDADVTLNDQYDQMTQAAALVNAANNQLSHYPEQPSGMDAALFELGRSGAGSSNLGMGYSSLGQAIVGGWLEDGDGSNIDRVGHRRWVFNPGMSQTGFGYVNSYSAMYSFDNARESFYTGVAWPAQNMPIEYFGSYYPWSISFNEAIDISTASVTLTRQSDSKSWTFNSSTTGKDYFNVDNGGYGLPGCIIFRPDPGNISYLAGDEFTVSITGVPEPLTYNVSFFSIKLQVTAKASSPKLKAGKKAFTYTKAKGEKSSRLQLQYSSNKKFKQSKKTWWKKTVWEKTIKEETTSVKIKKLKSKKTYYVRTRIMQYDKHLGEWCYGPWSKVKQTKIKR